MLYSNEIVFAGHPDKVCDQISAAIMQACIRKDHKTRAGIEVCGGKGIIFLTGELTTTADIDPIFITQETLKSIGYDYKKYEIINNIGLQSADISQGVDIGGAGDQGMMFGYATIETDSMLPTAMCILQELSLAYTSLVENDKRFLPDGKAQITGVYNDKHQLTSIKDFTISYQNTEEERTETDNIIRYITEEICDKYNIHDIQE